MRFKAPLAALTGEHHGPVTGGERFIRPPSEEVRLAQVRDEDRFPDPESSRLVSFATLLEFRQAVRLASRQRVRSAPQPEEMTEEHPDLPFVSDRPCTLDQVNGLTEFPPQDVDVRQSPASPDQGECVVEGFGEAEPLFADRDAFVEPATLGQRPGHVAA